MTFIATKIKAHEKYAVWTWPNSEVKSRTSHEPKLVKIRLIWSTVCIVVLIEQISYDCEKLAARMRSRRGKARQD